MLRCVDIENLPLIFPFVIEGLHLAYCCSLRFIALLYNPFLPLFLNHNARAMKNRRRWLITYLSTEASHSAPRIIYRADHSGRAITEHIVQAALRHPLIHVVTDTIVTDLILSNNACIGATVFDKLSKSHSSIFTSVGVTLASGGLAGIYTHSTNPPGFNALGSSTALAVRANITVADLEFVQFHPTALCIPGEPCFLLTEALRGEGAKLVTAEGYAFAKKFHPMGELAPRDVVARAVYAQSQLSGRVYLDITHRDAQWLRQRFPSIQEKVSQYGLDITKDKLPITPAAHYTCGGIVSDSNGCTSVQNLYVAGEAARTGLHGGNRLASTSLLEAIVWGSRYGQIRLRMFLYAADFDNTFTFCFYRFFNFLLNSKYC